MSMRRFRLVVNVLVVTAAWSVASANWVITAPAQATTYHHDEDVDTHGISTSHPTSRKVYFGYKDANGSWVPEQSATVSTQDVGGGMYEWDQTLLAPMSGWQLSPTGEMGETIADHSVWVFVQSTHTVEDRVEDLTVVQ